MRETKEIALGGMMAAMSIVLLAAGAMTGLGTYAAPLLVGLCQVPVGRKLGKKYHMLLWVAVSSLSFILISDVEQNLMYCCLFGFYPMIQPCFGKLKTGLKLLLKLCYFNVVVIALEAVIMLVLVPEAMGTVMALVLLLMGNVTFLCYDMLIPRADALLGKYLGRFL